MPLSSTLIPRVICLLPDLYNGYVRRDSPAQQTCRSRVRSGSGHCKENPLDDEIGTLGRQYQSQQTTAVFAPAWVSARGVQEVPSLATSFNWSLPLAAVAVRVYVAAPTLLAANV